MDDGPASENPAPSGNLSTPTATPSPRAISPTYDDIGHRQDADHDLGDPRGLSGIEDAPPIPHAADHAALPRRQPSTRPTSEPLHGIMTGPTAQTTPPPHRRQPAGAASAPPQGTKPDRPSCPVHASIVAEREEAALPTSRGVALAAPALGSRVPLQSPFKGDGRQRTGCRTTLVHHLDRRTEDLASVSRPSAAGTEQPPLTDRETELSQAMAALQQRCVALAADLAAAQARQGPLLQRLHSAGRAFAELLTPSPDGAVPSLTIQAMLSSFRGAPPGAPR